MGCLHNKNISNLILLYDEINFDNINKDYNDTNDFEPLISSIPDDSSSEDNID